MENLSSILIRNFALTPKSDDTEVSNMISDYMESLIDSIASPLQTQIDTLTKQVQSMLNILIYDEANERYLRDADGDELSFTSIEDAEYYVEDVLFADGEKDISMVYYIRCRGSEVNLSVLHYEDWADDFYDEDDDDWSPDEWLYSDEEEADLFYGDDDDDGLLGELVPA